MFSKYPGLPVLLDSFSTHATLRTSALLQGGVKLCDLTDDAFPKSRGFISNEHLMKEPIKSIGKGGTRENMDNSDDNNRLEDE